MKNTSSFGPKLTVFLLSVLATHIASFYCVGNQFSEGDCATFQIQNEDDPPQPPRMTPFVGIYNAPAASSTASVFPPSGLIRMG